MSQVINIKTARVFKKIGQGQPCFIVAEMSGNHNQSYQKAVEIVKAAADAGADAIKLQTYTPDTITIDSNKDAFIVKGKDNPEKWKGVKLYDLYKTAYTPWDWQPKLQQLAEGLGLIFFSTPFDDSAVDFLEKLQVPMYKIASYEATDFLLLRKVAKTGKPVIMSVGFATEDEIRFAINTLRYNGCKDIVILHCVTEYAGAHNLDAMNLVTIEDIRQKFNVIAGFSDNNAEIEVPVIAAGLGAAVIEKHLIINRDDNGPDSRFSVEPREFKEMVRRIRALESGAEKLDPNLPTVKRVAGRVQYGCQSEKERQNTFFRRSLFVVADIKKGEKFSKQNIRSIRPSPGLPTKEYDAIIGRVATRDIEKGTPLSWDLVSK